MEENETEVTVTPVEGHAVVTEDAPPAAEDAPAEPVVDSVAVEPPEEPVAAAPAPNPNPSVPAIRADTSEIVGVYATTPQQGQAIQEYSLALKSAKLTQATVEKAKSQSPEMQMGAKAAADNAHKNMLQKLEAMVVHFGHQITDDIHAELKMLHGIKL